jgi:hypothetical protein
VFGFAKCNANFFLGNSFHPCVVVHVCQPNNVNDLSILGSPCVTQSIFPIFFHGGVTINEIMCGDGI